MRFLTPSAILMLVALTGCERPPDLSNPKQHESGGLFFSYPGNWNVDVRDQNAIQVTTPDGAALSILRAAATDTTLDQVAERASQIYREELSGAGRIETEQEVGVQADINDLTRPGRKRRFVLETEDGRKIYHQTVYTLFYPGVSFVLVLQTSDEQARHNAPGFEFILSSLRYTQSDR